MIARHPLYTPTTGSRVGSNQRPPYRSHPQPFPVGIHLGDQTPPPAFPLPPTRNLPRRPDDLAHGLVLLNTFPSPPRQLPDPVQELPGPAGASQSCIDVHRPWRIYVYIYMYIYTHRVLGRWDSMPETTTSCGSAPYATSRCQTSYPHHLFQMMPNLFQMMPNTWPARSPSQPGRTTVNPQPNRSADTGSLRGTAAKREAKKQESRPSRGGSGGAPRTKVHGRNHAHTIYIYNNLNEQPLALLVKLCGCLPWALSLNHQASSCGTCDLLNAAVILLYTSPMSNTNLPSGQERKQSVHIYIYMYIYIHIERAI